MNRSLLGGVAALGAALALASPAGAASFGAPGLGDPFFPFAGNGGYDVANYSLTLDYRDRMGAIAEGYLPGRVGYGRDGFLVSPTIASQWAAVTGSVGTRNGVVELTNLPPTGPLSLPTA